MNVTGAPYIAEITTALGNQLSEIVISEVDVFQKRRMRLLQIAENEGAPADQRQSCMEELGRLPESLRHSGSVISGPRCLEPDSMTALPLLLLGSDGRRYVVGTFQVSVVRREYTVTGYATRKGDILSFSRELVPYRDDDLGEVLTGVDRLLSALNHVSTGYLRSISDSKGAAMPVIPGLDELVSPADSVFGSAPFMSASPSTSAVSRPVYAGAARASGAASQRSGGQEEASGGARRVLEKDPNAPAWFRNLRYNPTRKAEYEDFMETLAVPGYEELQRRNGTVRLEQFWQLLTTAALQRGVIEHHCSKLRDTKITLDERGVSAAVGTCSYARPPDGSRPCENQIILGAK